MIDWTYSMSNTQTPSAGHEAKGDGTISFWALNLYFLIEKILNIEWAAFVVRKGQSLEFGRFIFSPNYTEPSDLWGKLFLLSVPYFSCLQNAAYLTELGESEISAY